MNKRRIVTAHLVFMVKPGPKDQDRDYLPTYHAMVRNKLRGKREWKNQQDMCRADT